MKVHLLLIDCQKDFCQPANESLANAMFTANNGVETPQIAFTRNGGALCVPGADEDCVRLSAMINRLESKIDAIHVTLDSHNEVDIAHPVFLRDSQGNHPAPFTIISKEDLLNGVWTTTNPAYQKRAIEYATQLETNARYPWCIWPPHCIIGSEGYGIQDNVSEAIRAWGKNRFKLVNFVTKGSNPWTEHYSAVKADVVDPSDPTTMLNSNLIDIIDKADIVGIAGQALNYCVANTVGDLIAEFGAESVRKLHLLTDTCSDVPGYDSPFVAEATAQGMKVTTSTQFLA